MASTAILGRPTTYTTEVAQRICAAVSTSKHGLRKVLEDDPELPAYGTVVDWQMRYIDFSGELAHARQLRLRAWADDIVDVAQDETLDPADKRVIIDTKRWLLSKEMHRTYGDKLDITSGGEAIAAPAHQIDARVQSIIMQAQARRGQVVDIGELGDEAQKLLD